MAPMGLGIWHNRAVVHEPPLAAPLSDGEVHHFYWFIQGSIMNVGTRARLWRSWGFCERHAWAHLTVETAFRGGFLLGAAILYEDLVERAVHVLRDSPTSLRRWRRLRPKGPCMMCEMGVFEAGHGVAKPALLARGKSPDRLVTFARECRDHWTGTVCARCDPARDGALCRRHFVEDASRGSSALTHAPCATLEALHARLVVYRKAFTWELRGTDGPEHRAALISAIGWMSGWRPLLRHLDEV